MTESTGHEGARERLRFDVLPDGTVEGDDGAGGHLAATLRYVCRMSAQIGALLELGELERVSTLSNHALAARVSGVSPHVHIKAEVGLQGTQLPPPIIASGVRVQDAIDRALRRVIIDLGSDWVAIITDDGRLVGAVHDEMASRGAPESLHEVGVRVLAIVGAFDASLRETAVRLDFVRGSVLISAIGEHALYTHTDNFDVSEVVKTFAATHGLLVGADLARADLVTASRRA